MWPQDKSVIRQPGLVNPQPSMAAEQFGRSLDRFPPTAPSAGGGGATTGDWPLKLVAVDASNVKVLMGTVNGFTPTGINANIDVSGTDATWAIYMLAGISGTSVVGASVNADNTGTVPADDASSSYRLIGYVTVVGGVITEVQPAMAWSQEVVVCVDGDPTSFHWVVA